MKPPNWDRIQEIYHAARALPRAERNAFVTNECAGDADLLREVNSLLEADDSAGGFLDSPVVNLSSVSDDLVGTTIDERYEVVRELGRGGMGQVYLALALNLQRQRVVLKVLSHELVQDQQARERFEKEIEALLRIDHPAVVSVQDSGKLADGRPYIVMRYVDGEMLRSQIPSEGMDLRRAASILKQIGEALEHVHERGIFHRDLKPENILLKQGTDSIVLIDFGIAKVKGSMVAESTVEGASAGTLLYMSPEQLRAAEITAASDVYSMAVIAYEMITGRRPFRAVSPAQLSKMQEGGVRVKPGQLREDLSSKAQAIILKALSFEPMARYQSAEEFGDELARELLESHMPPRDKKPVNVVAASLAGLVAVALLLICIYIIFNGEGDPLRTHTFTYWLTIQKTRDGQDYQEPRQSNDDAIFESGDKFRLNVSSPEPGYIYVINEGRPEATDTSFTMVYPRKATNNGSASLGANQSVESDWIIFKGPQGSENFWIVWSASQVDELESAKVEAFNHPNGGLIGPTLVRVKEYLMAKQAEIKVAPRRYKATNKTVVRGTGDMLIMFVEIKHR